MRIPFQYTSRHYNNAEFSVANATTNYDVAANQTNLFGGATSMTGKTIYYTRIVTDQTITVRFNSTANNAVTITSSTSPFVMDELIEIDNLFITNNSGSAANIKILTAKPIEK